MDVASIGATLATGAVGGALLSWVRDAVRDWRHELARERAANSDCRAAVRLVRAELSGNGAIMTHVKEIGTNLPSGKDLPLSSAQFEAAKDQLARRLDYEDWARVATPYYRLQA
jgi:hypothetical protein